MENEPQTELIDTPIFDPPTVTETEPDTTTTTTKPKDEA